jgi:hypothetical protein
MPSDASMTEELSLMHGRHREQADGAPGWRCRNGASRLRSSVTPLAALGESVPRAGYSALLI